MKGIIDFKIPRTWRKNIYLTMLYKRNYRLKKFLRLYITKDENFIFVEHRKGNVFICDYGKTLGEAIRHVRAQLLDLYGEITDIPYSEMGPIIIEIKEFLEEYIERVE